MVTSEAYLRIRDKMDVLPENEIKVPSLIHAGIAWGVALWLGFRLQYVLLHGGDFSPAQLSESLGYATFACSYGFILCCFAISKLLKAQHALLKERSFFKSKGLISWTVFLMYAVELGCSLVEYPGLWGHVMELLYLLMFMGLFFLLYFGFSRLGINGRWILFLYLLLDFMPRCFQFGLWIFSEDWGVTYFNTSPFRLIVSASLYLAFIWQARRAVLILREKALDQEAMAVAGT